jgi:hypothetical protein
MKVEEMATEGSGQRRMGVCNKVTSLIIYRWFAENL